GVYSRRDKPAARLTRQSKIDDALVVFIHAHYLDARFALNHAPYWQQRLQVVDVVPTMVGDLDVRGADRAAAKRGVEGEPLAIDPDFRPHMICEDRALAQLGVYQPQGGARRHLDYATHGGGEHGIFGAVALERSGHLVGRGHRLREIQAPHVVV